jgi:tetratricopeptide (TPR) repeat protein
MKWIFPFLVLSNPAFAQDCPANPDHSARLSEIFIELQSVQRAGDANVLGQELWDIWTDAPDAKAQTLLDRGMALREARDFDSAWRVLDELVQYCPEFVEGWNQRAFASYLKQDFGDALIDLDRAIEMMPNHVAALSGRGLTLMGLGRFDEAQQSLKDAFALNPWLAERRLIDEPQGIDI